MGVAAFNIIDCCLLFPVSGTGRRCFDGKDVREQRSFEGLSRRPIVDAGAFSPALHVQYFIETKLGGAFLRAFLMAFLACLWAFLAFQ